MENWSDKKKNNEKKYLETVIMNNFLKTKNSLFKLEQDFIKLKEAELKDREIRIKKEIEELFIKPIIFSVGDMDTFEEEKMKRKDQLKKLAMIS